MEVDYILPNKVSEQDFEQIVYQWLSEGDYTPDDIIENIITQNNLALMPLYFSRDEYSGSCSVNLGYMRQEYYYSWDNINKRQVRHSRTVTDWHPHTQPVQGVTTSISYAGTKVVDQIVNFVEGTGWKAGDLKEIPSNAPRYNEMCSLFKISKDDSWKNRGSVKAYNEALKQTSPKLPSALQSNLSLNIKFSEATFFSVLAPYWLFSYEYNEGQYYVLVDGNNPERIDGIRPEDKKRKKEVVKIRWSGWLVGILGIILLLYFFNDMDFDKLELSWKNTGIVIGGIILTALLAETEVSKVKNKSKKARQQLLSQKLKQLEK